MSGLLTVEAILSRRDHALQVYKKLCDQILTSKSGSLSDPGQQTTTVNVPPPGAILSIVSWNIQTFEAGKSLSNPFVNVVINRILEALSADICVLLETRADSYINMNAIETGDVGTGDWKLSSGDEDEAGDNDDEDADTPDEDGEGKDDDDPSGGMSSEAGNGDDDDDDTAPDGGSGEPFVTEGGEPLRYDQLVSEMTGKRWVPPSRIYIYHPVLVQRAKLATDKVAIDRLYGKLEIQTGAPELDIQNMLGIAAQAKRKEGMACLNKFLDKNVAAQKQKGRKVKLTQKEKNKLLRMYKAFLADTNRFDPIKGVSKSESEFLTNYNKAPKWKKADTVIADPLGPSDQWKARLLSDDLTPIRLYYELLIVDNGFNEKVVDNWTDVWKAATSDNWRFVLHMRSCPLCNKMLGTVACGTIIGKTGNGGDIKCEDLGPYTTLLENLRQTVNSVTFYRGSAHESYSLLVRPSTAVSASLAEGTWLHEKQVRVAPVAAKLLMRAPSPKQTQKNPTKPVFRAGAMLGYQDGSSKFYGRCPFSVPIAMWFPFTGAREDMPLVVFHGPYGNSDKAGVEARAASMRELMKAAVTGDDSSLESSKNALVMGDFNLDYSPGSGQTQQIIANQLYDGFKQLGFIPMVEGGVATSLISIHGKAQTWKTTDSSASSNFTSSAYDNTFLKGDLVQKHHVTSAVIDIFSWIENDISDFDLPAHLDRPDGYDNLPAKTKAFYIYHRFVSDHLPIICDILVQGRDDTSENVRKALALKELLKNKASEQRTTLSFDAVLAYESVLDLSPTDTQTDSYQKQEGVSRYATVVGTIVGHEDDHLIIQCTPQPGLGSAWITYLPELKGKPIRGRLRQKFLEFLPPGKRVEVQLPAKMGQTITYFRRGQT